MLEVINLSKSYNEKKALDNINFKLENWYCCPLQSF